MTVAIVKWEPQPNFDAFVWAMWVMYGRAPKKAEPELDGSYELGEIGEVRLEDQRLLRDTPYSV